MSGAPSRVLILACSATKDSSPGLLPARDRYDGPAFRVVRAALRRSDTAPVAIIILSAEYGLIGWEHPIPNYNRAMTPARASELRPGLVAQWHRLTAHLGTVEAIHVYGGAVYRDAVRSLPRDQRASGITWSRGGIGRQLQQLKCWLSTTASAVAIQST